VVPANTSHAEVTGSRRAMRSMTGTRTRLEPMYLTTTEKIGAVAVVTTANRASSRMPAFRAGWPSAVGA
jgi:hypothetical protein